MIFMECGRLMNEPLLRYREFDKRPYLKLIIRVKEKALIKEDKATCKPYMLYMLDDTAEFYHKRLKKFDYIYFSGRVRYKDIYDKGKKGSIRSYFLLVDYCEVIYRKNVFIKSL